MNVKGDVQALNTDNSLTNEQKIFLHGLNGSKARGQKGRRLATSIHAAAPAPASCKADLALQWARRPEIDK